MDFIGIQNPEKCTKCYKCVQECFTKAIKIDGDKTNVEINKDLCVECGYCTKACKLNIPVTNSNKQTLHELVLSGKEIHVILDTLYQSDFKDTSFHQTKSAILAAGFSNVIENYTGFSLHRYISNKYFQENDKPVFEGFCVTFNTFIGKFYPELLEYMAPVATPENISSRLLKEKYGQDIITIYATTCFSPEKKNSPFDCDLVILTSELREYLEEHSIHIEDYPDSNEPIKEYYFTPKNNINIHTIESCVEVLEYVKKHSTDKKFFTPYWCDSCFASPVFTNTLSGFERKCLYEQYKEKSYLFTNLNDINISEFGDLNRFKIKPISNPVIKHIFSTEEIKETLKTFGRNSESDCFDCGACGYSTCKRNAIAILEGKSTPNQCIPFISQKYLESLTATDTAYKELDDAFALTIPNSRLEKKLKHTREYKDEYIKETGKIRINDVILDGTYRHVVNALKVCADLHSKGVMSVIGLNKDTLVKTIIFHDIGKSQPALNIGDEVYPKDIFEDGKLHAERSAELAISNYSNEGINTDVYTLIKYHHHSEKELPDDFPQHLLPMYRLFRIIDGISAGLTRRGNTIVFELIGSVLYIKEHSQNPNYRRYYSLDLYKPEYLKKDYDFEDTLETILKSKKYK